ncbi:hypothetical protein [Candidatus Xianfuyuplasma coldseepsis]|uniref:Uncharacterized protein n=1 Tax=Candidatus Xianfuyuplasma coldseepsis TaxID=2782163 RepID=A0A7L7KSS5_9MOLU|nr:hypothetical protein [Xianfuyuplasma coldseepsis]QMS84828.1 hypothetical protein G4Z02_03355 [Xianfuyuplasma coldseepsis]
MNILKEYRNYKKDLFYRPLGAIILTMILSLFFTLGYVIEAIDTTFVLVSGFIMIGLNIIMIPRLIRGLKLIDDMHLNTKVLKGEVSKVYDFVWFDTRGHNTLVFVVNGIKFYILCKDKMPKVSDEISITYLPKSKVVIDFEYIKG